MVLALVRISAGADYASASGRKVVQALKTSLTLIGPVRVVPLERVEKVELVS